MWGMAFSFGVRSSYPLDDLLTLAIALANADAKVWPDTEIALGPYICSNTSSSEFC